MLYVFTTWRVGVALRPNLHDPRRVAETYHGRTILTHYEEPLAEATLLNPIHKCHSAAQTTWVEWQAPLRRIRRWGAFEAFLVPLYRRHPEGGLRLSSSGSRFYRYSGPDSL